MDVGNVLVNGIELVKGSSLATLRTSCSFLGISGSDSTLKKGLHQDSQAQQKDGIVECHKLGE